jgi:hypothetical protein
VYEKIIGNNYFGSLCGRSSICQSKHNEQKARSEERKPGSENRKKGNQEKERMQTHLLAFLLTDL